MPETYSPVLRPLTSSLPPQLRVGCGYQLVYRVPGTSAEFSFYGIVAGLLQREAREYLSLEAGQELPLAWLVAVNGQRLAA
ncbi:hypothetical protein LRS06_09140 [Hymenobacter sp. J193]|uniref:hypothetical protein n=1 Tax=Hymenobacter sp. J193 TaxID=2898429 RepID=UPI00215117E9|nr:hypothetical protein [Hymenobacter sp. J193]MCR5887940.1 hypothetical protein [Hymenobacter sp. J193]